MGELNDRLLLDAILPLRSRPVSVVTAKMKEWGLLASAMRRGLAMHCLLQLYEVSDKSTVKKGRLYDDTKLYFEHFYATGFVGAPEMGKLVKLVFHSPTRRIGSKSVAKYCHGNIRMRANKVRWFESKRPRRKATFIAEDIRFKIIMHPKVSSLDDLFEKFLYGENLRTVTLDTTDERLHIASKMLIKSDSLFQNFLRSIEEEGVVTMMLIDWYSLDVASLLKQTAPFSDASLLLINTFPLVLDPSLEVNQQLGRTLVTRYYKLHYNESRVNTQKLKMIQFLIQLFIQFDSFSFPEFILNFKYTATTLLRNLSMSQKSSFASYWILYCFLDEFTPFMLEYYCYKKS